jgi:hypothetical protein
MIPTRKARFYSGFSFIRHDLAYVLPVDKSELIPPILSLRSDKIGGMSFCENIAWQVSRKNKSLGRTPRAPSSYFFDGNLRKLPSRVKKQVP